MECNTRPAKTSRFAIRHPFLTLLASLSRQELAREVAYLKGRESTPAKQRLPKRITLTDQQRRRLGKPLGARNGLQSEGAGAFFSDHRSLILRHFAASMLLYRAALKTTTRTAVAVRVGRRKFRRYLLSRLWHYHRLWKLNCRVRDGNGCDLPDMITGKY